MNKILHHLYYWLARFFWRKASRLSKENPDFKKPVGIPYQRDPDAPCAYYEPVKRSANCWQDCETDGHYLCKGCFHNIENGPLAEKQKEE
jgi:hypothetical protein